MTDKVQKIREEVVRMHNLLPVMDGYNFSVNYADRIYTTLEMYIDSLQKEPESHYPSFEESQGEVILYGLNGSVGTKAEPESKVGEIIDLDKLGNKCMFAKDNYTDEERKVLCKDCEEECEYAKKEPVSEDLEEAAEDYGIRQGVELKPFAIKFFKAGANWQKEKTIKKACDWITEINNHHYIMRYSDSCEVTSKELIEGFKNYMDE